MLKSETIKLTTTHGIFSPIYRYQEEKPIYDEENNIVDWELVGYAEIMTAEEHYQKWLYDKENPPQAEQTLDDKISILTGSNEKLTNMMTDLIVKSL